MADLVDYDQLVEFITAGIDALSIDTWDEQNPGHHPAFVSGSGQEVSGSWPNISNADNERPRQEEEEEEVNVDGPEPMDVDEFVGQVELEEYDDHHFEIQVNENVTTVKFKCMDGRGCEVLVLGGEVLLRFL
ncbi:hypothetical protein TorRG33x02_093700 [Trema orientale]|uniref:Uncharacterized protein n=1 Tax=Trema orientale TaxID=63057 RepID=A0A2P5FAP9_TREOI|nr:hypothetical protein TorRG33x02_093700 [Trema orientale]